MNLLLSAKGSDVTAWRAVEDFTAEYRQALLELAASNRSGSAENIILDTCAALEAAVFTHQNLLKRLEGLIEKVGTATTATNLTELTDAFYSDLYCHFGQFRSAPVFYQLSMAFLKQASATIIRQAIDQLAPPARQLPEMALIALGPAGRCEYSPFYPLQILLVHGEAAESQREDIQRICQALHDGLESAGLAVDAGVTPRNPIWRGTIAEWGQRCEEWLYPQSAEEFINLCRLADQYPLYPAEGFGRELQGISRAALNGSHAALAHLVDRMASHSNGLGLMGRLKLERRENVRGLFRLMDFGLLPLSEALSTLALIKESQAISTCDRITDLMRRQELDVELAERMLATWYNLHDLQLRQEQSFHIGERSTTPAFLNPEELTAEQRQSLKQSLESVANIQRHAEIIFSGMGE